MGMKELTERLKKARKAGSTECLHDKVYWDKHSEVFGGENEEETRTLEAKRQFNFIRKHMPDVKSALDCGCAHGHLVLEMRKAGIDARGIDISKYVLERAHKDAKFFLTKMDIAKMPFPDNLFDAVVAFNTCEHLFYNELLGAIPRMNAVAKKYIVLLLPVPIWAAEPWVSDYSYTGGTNAPHVSVYPWEFWARKFMELGKFKWWFTNLFLIPGCKEPELAEAWIAFERKDKEEAQNG